jgi:transposase InsO family protein
LRQQGVRCSRKRVARLRQQHSIRTRRPKWRVAPNLLQRDFSAKAPNEKWVGDILGIWTDEGWLYLAALLDTYSRFIVGWAMSIYHDEALVTDALRVVLARRELPEDTDLIQHTDRGNQYTADDYLALLKDYGIQVSMSGKGNPYDNAMMESFFSTLRAARTAVFEFIEVFYNRQRLHSGIDYARPVSCAA